MKAALSKTIDPLTILILDDCAFDRARLRRMLRVARIQCLISEARNLSEFKQILSNATVSVACLDYDLPDGTGLDALLHLNADERNSKTLSLLITGNQMPHIREKACQLGCFSYLPKCQVSPELLTTVISEGLSCMVSKEKNALRSLSQ